MNDRLMILPAREPADIRAIRIPDDFEEHEAFRYVTGLIASVEEKDRNYRPEDIAAVLEDNGFEPVELLLGPSLD
jgi:hypothetical protein